jgi:hypothetical protein
MLCVCHGVQPASPHNSTSLTLRLDGLFVRMKSQSTTRGCSPPSTFQYPQARVDPQVTETFACLLSSSPELRTLGGHPRSRPCVLESRAIAPRSSQKGRGQSTTVYTRVMLHCRRRPGRNITPSGGTRSLVIRSGPRKHPQASRPVSPATSFAAVWPPHHADLLV